MRFIGNLGRYQEITSQAKEAGGVDRYLAEERRDAVSQAAPILLATGAFVALSIEKVVAHIRHKLRERDQNGRACKTADNDLRTAPESTTTQTMNCEPEVQDSHPSESGGDEQHYIDNEGDNYANRS